MLLLQESYSSFLKAPSPDIGFWDPNIPIAESVAKEAARIGRAFMSSKAPATEQVSPFILHLFYCSQAIYREKVRRTGSESAAEAAETLNKVLDVMDGRWKVAGMWNVCKTSDQS